MPKVYVMNATVSRGGTYMAYHLARILHKAFALPVVNVLEKAADQPIFSYDIPMQVMAVAEMEKSIAADDLLIVNPSAASHYMYGLRLPGHKIMYIQDFRTYSYLDCHFDLYGCVGTLVQDFLKVTYGMDVPIIPPFIELEKIPAGAPWEQRPANLVLVYMKQVDAQHTVLLDYIRKKTAGLSLEYRVISNYRLTHEAFTHQLGQARYLLNLSIAEGFGLVPLEAMAAGTLVLGLDGLAGRDYMRFGVNSLTVPFRDFRKLPDIMAAALADTGRSMQITTQARHDAAAYNYQRFHDAWLAQFKAFLAT